MQVSGQEPHEAKPGDNLTSMGAGVTGQTDDGNLESEQQDQVMMEMPDEVGYFSNAKPGDEAHESFRSGNKS